MNKASLVFFILCFAIIGAFLILVSKANTPAVVFEAENGSINGPAATVSSPSASNGSAIQFGKPASVYSGVFVTSGLINNFAAVTSFEADSEKPVSILNVFSSWGQNNGSEKFSPQMMDKIRNHGSIPLFTWEPWDTSLPPDSQPNYQLQDITNGTYDTYITEWALAAKSWGHPFFLRFAHEMNGNWYPWAELTNGNGPGQYITAWRHVHDIFTKNNVTNVTWVWCTNINYNGSKPLNSLYPGDNYVDWVSYDSYNRGTVNGNIWRSFSQLSTSTYQDFQLIAPGKPVMVAEYGTVEDGGSKAQWFRDTLKYDLKVTFPRVKAVSYFDLNKNYDNRINSTELSRAAFAESIGLSYYASNSYNSLTGSPILPLLFDAVAGLDTMPPYATITLPNSSKINAGQQLHMQASAIDKSGIKKVDFYVNGSIVCNENQFPYDCYWNVPVGIGNAYTLSIKAYDQLDNVVQSSAAVITQ